MAEYKGIDNLKNKLAMKRSRVVTRYRYYEMKNLVRDFGISTPPDLRYFMSTLGWCAKAVDSLADRLSFDGFDNDYFDLEGIYSMNNRDVLIDSTGVLIGICALNLVRRRRQLRHQQADERFRKEKEG